METIVVKKLKFKKWLEMTILVIFGIAFMFLATTIDSEWTASYLKMAGVSFVVMTVCAYLLFKFGRTFADEEE